MNDNCEIYDVIVIGAGAAGLFYAAGSSLSGRAGRRLILEKTAHPGQKLLMSGNGMCNITHGGSIKAFVDKYADNGRLIRGCLYKHNNLELIALMERLGVHLTEREDGKIFPGSMKAKDVLDALLCAAENSGWQIRCNTEVTAIRPAPVGAVSAPFGPVPDGALDDVSALFGPVPDGATDGAISRVL